MKRRSQYIPVVLVVLVLCTSIFSGASGISVGIAHAADSEIRVGLLFGSNAPTEITLDRIGGGNIAAKDGGEVPLYTIQGGGTLNWRALAGGTQYRTLTGFSNLQAADTEAKRLSQLGVDAVAVWNTSWQVWLSGEDNIIKSALGGELPPAITAPELIETSFGSRRFLSGSSLGFYPGGQDETTFVQGKGRRYRGMMEVSLTVNGRLQLVNQLPLEQYLLGVVPYEMSPSWEPEALKAQAVAARTFALRNWYKYSSLGFNIDDTTNSQVYYGYSAQYETPRIIQAVYSTQGQVIYHRGSLIESLYHSDCGGHTEDARNVWGGRVEYLLGRECGFCEGAPRNKWEYQTVVAGMDLLGRLGFQDLLLSRGLIPGGFVIDRIELVKLVTESGFERRVEGVILTGSDGSVLNLAAGPVYTALYSATGSVTVPGSQRMWSRFFDLSTDATVFMVTAAKTDLRHGGLTNLNIMNGSGKTEKPWGPTVAVMTATGVENIPVRPTFLNFPGGGWGHGVGMCQWGAQGMAKQGYNYIQILQYYYSSVDIF